MRLDLYLPSPLVLPPLLWQSLWVHLSVDGRQQSHSKEGSCFPSHSFSLQWMTTSSSSSSVDGFGGGRGGDAATEGRKETDLCVLRITYPPLHLTLKYEYLWRDNVYHEEDERNMKSWWGRHKKTCSTFIVMCSEEDISCLLFFSSSYSFSWGGTLLLLGEVLQSECDTVLQRIRGVLPGWVDETKSWNRSNRRRRAWIGRGTFVLSVLSPIYAATNQKTVRDSFRLEILGSDKEY